MRAQFQPAATMDVFLTSVHRDIAISADGRFVTGSSGTGLGLPMTGKVIEAHGGTIEVQSAAGKGTRFTVVLPP